MRLVSEQLQNDIPGMLAHLESIGCTARRSELLPGEFLVVDSRSKFQALLQTYVTSRTGGECQVTFGHLLETPQQEEGHWGGTQLGLQLRLWPSRNSPSAVKISP